MTNKEFVLNALNNKPVPRPPVGFWFHHVQRPEKALGLENPEIIEQNVAGHKRYFDNFHPDFVKVMSDGFFGYPIDGQIKTVQDLAKIKPLDASHPWITGQTDLVKRVTSLQKDTLYFYNIFGPLTILKFLVGVDKTVEFLKQEPDLLAAALKRMAQGIALQAEAVIKQGGASGIYLSVQNPDISKVTDDEYHKIVTPADKIVLDVTNAASENNILHICGYEGAKNHLAAWTEYKAKAYNWAVNVEGVSLGEGKKLFGGAAVIGGFDNTRDGILYKKGTKAEIETFTEKLIAEAGKTGVIIGADCTVPDDIDFERFEWVRGAAMHSA
jgi:uroporphyrinogen decarboxylase